MDGRNNATLDCSIGALEPCYSKMTWPTDYNTTTFHRIIRNQIWQVDALLITGAVLAVIIVGVGAYGQRYRHHPFTRFIFLGATTLFLPIVSFVVSTISNSTNTNYVSYVKIIDRSWDDYEVDPDGLSAFVARCKGTFHYAVIVIWALLVQIVMVNTSTIAATEGQEGRSKGPPIDLIVQGAWTFYLGVTFVGHDNWMDEDDIFTFLIAPFVLLCSKIALKCYAFEKARRSFALGRNPGLTFVYMEKLRVQEANQQSEPQPPVGNDAPPPPLLVMREEEKQVEIKPHGYAFKDDSGTELTINNGLVTLDTIWQLDSIHQIFSPQLKGLCFSFALFKLLRCRFASYKLTNAGSMGTLTFFRTLALQSGEHDRIFKVIADELSFVHDYYYSSLPISYAKCCLPILNSFLSLLNIGYCIRLAVIFINFLTTFLRIASLGSAKHLISSLPEQLDCDVWWIDGHLVSNFASKSFGSILIDEVLVILLVVLVMVAEVRDMVLYICSNWTKVALVCRYINYTSAQGSLCMQKWVISLLLRCRFKLIMKQHWNEKMSQCSVLVLHHHRTTIPTFVRRLLPLPDQTWSVKVTAAVKVCIINALKSVINGGLSKGVLSLRRSQVGQSFLLACDGKGTSETVLIWHIATCIVVHVRHRLGEASDSDHKTVATQLSQYCAYLVSWCPQLLPDNSAWSTSLYKDVKKDAEGALAGYSVIEPSTPEDEHALDDYSVAADAEAESSIAEDERAYEHPVADQSSTREDGYQKLVRLLSENSKHEVVKDGVKLGKQLVETIEDQETMWKLLAEFWSEMILYLAPSDNLKGHSDAIARGGELITLLWALLFHAGIVSRPGEDDDAAATSAGVV